MPRDLFVRPPESPETRRNIRLLPLSIALHALVVSGAIIVPLLADGELPALPTERIVAVLATTPPPPSPPDVARVRPARAPAAAVPAPVVRPGPPISDVAPQPPAGPPVGTGIPNGITDEFPATGVGGDGLGVGAFGPPGPGPAAPEVPVRVGGDIERPRRIRYVSPKYPTIALQAKVEGTVVIDAIIGRDGRVQRATVRESRPLLDEAALRAVRQWVYTPTRLNDVPVAVIMTVEVRFRLGG